MYKAFKPNLVLKSLMVLVTIAIFNLFATPSLAQDLKITGKVLGTNSSTIPGATIKVKGKPAVTATDIDGNFTIKALKGDVLTVSYVGYKSQDVTIASSTSLTVNLEEDSQKIDEVVVIGYGTMKKSDVTGAVTSIKKDDITKRATSNAAEALQGRIAGVNIQKTGGNAGAGVQMKIRGVNTMGGNDPLYIIDGFPGSINSVNPSDIESIEILKDGAASAIYGSIAANGVVIISTKKAKEGSISVDFSSYLSMTQTSKTFDLLDAKEYVSVHKQMYEEYNKQYPTKVKPLPEYITKASDINTDWQDAVMRNGLAQNYSVGITGGQDNLKFALSSNYFNEKGIIIGNEVNHKNARLKINFKKSIVDVDANMFFKVSTKEQPKFSLKEVYMISPLVPIYDETKKSGYGLSDNFGLPNNRNVIADDHYKQSFTDGQEFNGNVSVALNFTKWLEFKSSYSYKGNNYQSFYHAPSYTADDKAPNLYAYNSDSRSMWQEQLVDNILNFNKQLGSHSISAMVGTSTTLTESNWNSISVEGKKIVNSVDESGNLKQTIISDGFLDENFTTIDGGSGGVFNGSGSKYKYNRLSVFGRLNYSYANKYLVQATIRRDASSKFGKNNRWGTFPSIALGWKISEEEFFFKESVVNNLKLRASFGRLGNENALGYYDFIPSIVTGNDLWSGYVQGSGYTPWQGSFANLVRNDNLKWETTNSINFGLDFGLLKNKITGSVNYFQKNTSDLLISRVPAPSSGFSIQTMNVGEIKNSGVEFEVNYNDSKGKFNYNIGFNLSYLKNEVVKLADKDQDIKGEGLKYGTDHYVTHTIVGKPIASYYLYKTDGLFQSMEEVSKYVNKNGELLQPKARPGDIRFKDINNDGVLDESDKVFCGSGMPKVDANITFSGSYSNIDISFLVGSAWGHKLYNGNRYFYEGMASGSNFLNSALNAWTPTNTNTDVPRAVLQDPNKNSRESDRFLENGDFIRLRQIQIGYTLPKSLLSKAGITNFRIYASGENLYTWTNYSGIDPEFGRTDVLNTGVDKILFPFTRSYVLGVQLTF